MTAYKEAYKTELRFSFFYVFFVSKGNLLDFLLKRLRFMTLPFSMFQLLFSNTIYEKELN